MAREVKKEHLLPENNLKAEETVEQDIEIDPTTDGIHIAVDRTPFHKYSEDTLVAEFYGCIFVDGKQEGGKSGIQFNGGVFKEYNPNLTKDMTEDEKIRKTSSICYKLRGKGKKKRVLRLTSKCYVDAPLKFTITELGEDDGRTNLSRLRVR